ncbi:hypothetical protein GR927_37625 [Mycolicibacterium sp. 3033]|nr:hypothetical protein [Mycolicibacterium aurantiacum]
MPSFRRRESVIDADRVDETPPVPESGSAAERARALAEEAEAEAAEAEAMAAAARARARALRLRREADGADQPEDARAASGQPDVGAEPEPVAEPDDAEPDTVGPDDARPHATPEAETTAGTDTTAEAQGTVSATGDVDTADTTDEAGSREVSDDADSATPARRRSWLGWRRVAAAVCVMAVIALLSLSGYMIWNHRQAEMREQAYAEYTAAARQAVVSLMSLDFNNAEADVSRIIDNSTGQFREDFEGAAQDFVKIAQESKVVTDVTVTAAAVQSMTDDSAEVLVAATSRVSNTTGANQQPRSWRLSVSLQREAEQIKMSKVEFVP